MEEIDTRVPADKIYKSLTFNLTELEYNVLLTLTKTPIEYLSKKILEEVQTRIDYIHEEYMKEAQEDETLPLSRNAKQSYENGKVKGKKYCKSVLEQEQENVK